MKKYILILFIVFVAPTLVWADAYTLTVEGLVCDFCAQGIKKKLDKNFKDQKIKDILVDLDGKKVTFEAESVDQKKLEEIIKDAGYTLKSVDVKPLSNEQTKTDTTVPPKTEVQPKPDTSATPKAVKK